MSSFNVTFVARTRPPGLDSKEGRPPFAPLGRIDATSNRADSAGIDCALRIPVSPPEVRTRNPNNNALALRLAQTLEIGVVIIGSLEKLCGFSFVAHGGSVDSFKIGTHFRCSKQRFDQRRL